MIKEGAKVLIFSFKHKNTPKNYLSQLLKLTAANHKNQPDIYNKN